MRRGSLFGVGWLGAVALATAAIVRFAVVGHRAWEHRAQPLDLQASLAHSHLLYLAPRTQAQIVLLPAVAFVCLASVPLLRAGIREGVRSWRGALAGSSLIAATIIAVALYRYQHPSPATYGRIHAAAQARELARIATDVVLFTLTAIAAARARRLRDATP